MPSHDPAAAHRREEYENYNGMSDTFPFDPLTANVVLCIHVLFKRTVIRGCTFSQLLSIGGKLRQKQHSGCGVRATVLHQPAMELQKGRLRWNT